MNAPGSAVVNTIKSGGNTVKMLNNLTYQEESFVGDNQTGDAAKTARGYTGQPNLKFWEGHTDIGGPIKKDRLWYFGAYNHFKIDKQISGVPRTIATDLGVFDNETTKETWKVSQKDTVIGYFQWGRKQKPNRGLSVTVAPEAAQPQDSVSWVFKGEHQRVWSSRFFTSAKFNLFGYERLIAPALFWSEVWSALHEMRWRKEISAGLADIAFERLLAAPVSPRQVALSMRAMSSFAQSTALSTLGTTSRPVPASS